MYWMKSQMFYETLVRSLTWNLYLVVAMYKYFTVQYFPHSVSLSLARALYKIDNSTFFVFLAFEK